MKQIKCKEKHRKSLHVSSILSTKLKPFSLFITQVCQSRAFPFLLSLLNFLISFQNTTAAPPFKKTKPLALSTASSLFFFKRKKKNPCHLSFLFFYRETSMQSSSFSLLVSTLQPLISWVFIVKRMHPCGLPSWLVEKAPCSSSWRAIAWIFADIGR